MTGISSNRIRVAFVASLAIVAGALQAWAPLGVTFSYDDYATVLERFVDEDGMVDYQALKNNREPLDRFMRDLCGLYREEFADWTEERQIAFWLNAYNAITLKTIINHHPIEADWKKRLFYPVGIRHIPGVWTEIEHCVKGEQLTLDAMEHDILRKEYNEPRIHMALVCAAMGCPALRTEPFVGHRLDEQLAEQTRRFIQDPSKFRIDHEERRVYLSSIFKWFGEDFVPTYGSKASVPWGSREEQAVMAFLGEHLSPSDWNQLTSHEYDVSYLDYDWSLNEQAS